MHSAVALLKAISVAFPPFSGCNHNLTLAESPITAPNAAKDQSRLCLQLMSRGHLAYWLDENDFNRPVEDLIAEIIKMQTEALKHLGDAQADPS